MIKITVSTKTLTRDLNGETVLLDLACEKFFGLDEVSARVWQLLREGVDRSGVIDTLLDEYEVERRTLEKDIDALLGDLGAAGLITRG